MIYKITNNVNGKVYIGQTVRTLEERTKEHKAHKTQVVDRAIRKYGIANFTVESIDRADSIEELNNKEIYWIAFYNCMIPNGYNTCNGGNNTQGYSHREESKKKMSVTKSAMYLGKNNPFFGKTHSDEQKAKWGVQRKGRDMTKVTEASFAKSRRSVLNIDTGEIFISIVHAAQKYGLKETHISRVCRGGRKTTGGFRWAYQT